MSKKIVYTVTDNGIDGRGPTVTLYASYNETERDRMLEEDKSKAWRSTHEQIVDMDTAVCQALSKLNGIDRLVLGLPPWPKRHL